MTVYKYQRAFPLDWLQITAVAITGVLFILTIAPADW